MQTGCRFCGKDPKVIVVLPWEGGEELGRQSPYSCVPCATEKGYYCPTHRKPFTGSTAGHAFCVDCIRVELSLRENEAKPLYAKIARSLCAGDQSELEEAAKFAAELTGGSKEMAVLRFVITLRHRKRITIDEANDLATSANALRELLPVTLW